MRNAPLHTRVFNVPLEFRESSDGRTVFGRVVPYGTVARFRDHDGEIKSERFVHGSLDNARRAWHRVKLIYGHEDGFRDHIGHGISLEERSDGGYALFRLLAADAERAREILSTTHKALSLGFYAIRSRVAPDGVIERLAVAVDHVGAVAEGAYEDARVLAVRESTPDGETVDEADPPATPNLDAVRAELRVLRMSPEERRAYESAFPEHRGVTP